MYVFVCARIDGIQTDRVPKVQTQGCANAMAHWSPVARRGKLSERASEQKAGAVCIYGRYCIGETCTCKYVGTVFGTLVDDLLFSFAVLRNFFVSEHR